MPSKYNDSSDTNLRWFISHSNLPHYFRFCSTMVRCFWLHFCQIVFFVCSRKAIRLFWVFLPYHFGNIYFRNMPFKCQTRKQFWTSLHFMHVLKRNRKLTRWISNPGYKLLLLPSVLIDYQCSHIQFRILRFCMDRSFVSCSSATMVGTTWENLKLGTSETISKYICIHFSFY